MTLAILDARDKEYVVVAAGADLITSYVHQAIAAGQTAQEVLDAILAAGLSEGVFPSLAAGESGTTDGQYFWVGDGGTVTLYRNDSGTGAEIAELATTAALGSPAGAGMVGLANGTVKDAVKWFTPEQFGAVGGGVTDDSAAFVAMAADINAAGAAGIVLAQKYRVSAPLNGSVCRLENLTALRVTGEGEVIADPLPLVWKAATSASAVGTTVTVLDATHSLTIGREIILRGMTPTSPNGFQTVSAAVPGVSFSYVCGVAPGAITGTPEYTDADYGRNIWRLVDCSNVQIDTKVSGEARPVDQQYRLGYKGLFISGTCTDVFVTLRGSGLSYGFAQDDVLRRGEIRVSGNDLGYACSTVDADGFQINVDADTVHRGVYFVNGGNSDIFARVANYDVTAVVLSRTVNGTSENIRVNAPAAPQNAALTLHRASSGVNILLTAQNAFTGGFRNIELNAELNVTNTAGLLRWPVQVNLAAVTGRADDIRIQNRVNRAGQTVAADLDRELVFSSPASCTVGNLSILSVCGDPAGIDSVSASKGFTVSIGAADGILSFDRRGGRTGYFLSLPSGADVRWISPSRPKPAGGLSFPLTTNKQVVWGASNIGTGDFTVWMRMSSPNDLTGGRPIFFAGSSTPGRSPSGMWAQFDGSGNDLSFYILGATVNDSSSRTFADVDRYMILPGFNDVFFVRRAGALELWVNGIRLNGVQATAGTPPGEGGSLTTPLIFFNASTGNPFANELAGSGFFSKALSIDEMTGVSAGSPLADKTKILHQTDYRGTRKLRFPNSYSAFTADIGSDVSLIDPSNMIEVSVVIDPPSIAAGAVSTVTATVTGAVVGSAVTASPRNALPAGVVQMNPGRVSATNTVSIDLLNVTGGAIDPPSNTWDIRVGR